MRLIEYPVNFQAALGYLMSNEGGFIYDPADSGGPTKFGITIETLRCSRNFPVTELDVKCLTIEEAAAIYKREYWDRLYLDQVKEFKIACAMFDIAVVRGCSISARYAQEAVCQIAYSIRIDSKIGPATVEALNFVNPRHFVTVMAELTEKGFAEVVLAKPKNQRFAKGWMLRARRLLKLRELGAEAYLAPKSTPLT